MSARTREWAHFSERNISSLSGAEIHDYGIWRIQHLTDEEAPGLLSNAPRSGSPASSWGANPPAQRSAQMPKERKASNSAKCRECDKSFEPSYEGGTWCNKCHIKWSVANDRRKTRRSVEGVFLLTIVAAVAACCSEQSPMKSVVVLSHLPVT